MGLGPTLLQCDLILMTSATTLFPNEVTLRGPGVSGPGCMNFGGIQSMTDGRLEEGPWELGQESRAGQGSARGDILFLAGQF